MDNKRTIKHTCYLIITLLLTVSCHAQQQDRPNFIILVGDDISADAIGCYGAENKGVTPNIDKLSSKGVKFNNMFVTNAICAPTRAELFTGKQPYRNGCTGNRKPTNADVKSVAHYLKDLGYRVALTGKRHYKPAAVYPFRYIEGFTEHVKVRGPELEEDWDALTDFIEEDKTKPFCLFICSVHAHAPWDAGNSDQWKMGDLTLPPHFVDNKVTRHFYREYLGEVNEFDRQVGKAAALIKEQALDENTVLMVLDENGAGMPLGKWSNYDWGVRSACIMQWPEKYQANFDTDIIAQYCDILPTLIDAAGGEVPDDMDGKSLMPVITKNKKKHREHAFFVYSQDGNESRGVFDGRYKLIWNLTHEKEFHVGGINGTEKWKEHMLDRHVNFMFKSWVERAKTNEDAQEKVNHFLWRPEFELFDLDDDPKELNNLVENDAYQGKVKKLQDELIAWMQSQGDSKYLSDN